MQNSSRIDKTGSEKPFFLFYPAVLEWMEYKFFLQKDNLFLWVPVCFACGVGVYFSLSFEPPIILSVFMLCFWSAIHLLIRPIKKVNIWGQTCVMLSFIIFLVFAGFTAATMRTNNIYTPVLSKKIGPVTVSGHIIAIEKMEEGDGSRITLSSLTIEKLSPEKTPRKIRLRLRADDNVEIGQSIKALALLNPPSPPLFPDGFNFRRYLYFQGIGAVGFIYSAPEITEQARSNAWDIEPIRHYIAARIIEFLTPRQASIALALIVGQKKALSDDDAQAIRDAGLAHMLAISGLHVGLVASALFFFIRLAMVMIPNLALRVSVKKVAAVFALCGAIFYMLIAGSTIPTQRAVMMTAIVFLAIIIDRSPISLRLVALSALVILIIAPESLMSASFHMSFAAVTCLIYFYEVTRKFWMEWYKKRGWYRKFLLYFISVCMTTLIASIATAPFALYHFGQVSYLGSLSNFVAVPLLAFIIMPFALLSLISMPFGLDYWPLQLVGIGTKYILDISYWAASLPDAVIYTSAWGFLPFVILVLSTLFMILWKGIGKLCAVPLIVLSMVMLHNQVYPDILVSSSHKLFGFKDRDSALYVSTRRREKFVLKNWERFYGLEEKSAQRLLYKGSQKELRDFHSCGDGGCRFVIAGHNVSFIRRAYIQDQECGWANIIISIQPMARNYKRKNHCKAQVIIDKFDSWQNGAYAVWVTSEKVTVRNVAETTSNRPWSAYPPKPKNRHFEKKHENK
ncbi:MAG: hypothetical protein COA45_02645 [Zetaproteobacteria bacterium]|nr:MAG: hypothetical protein COA45_02645 [Zetaproteobacteria bacterium]